MERVMEFTCVAALKAGERLGSSFKSNGKGNGKSNGIYLCCCLESYGETGLRLQEYWKR